MISQAFASFSSNANALSQRFAIIRKLSQIWFGRLSQAFAQIRKCAFAVFRNISQAFTIYGFARIRKWTFARIRQGLASAKIMIFCKEHFADAEAGPWLRRELEVLPVGVQMSKGVQMSNMLCSSESSSHLHMMSSWDRNKYSLRLPVTTGCGPPPAGRTTAPGQREFSERVR